MSEQLLKKKLNTFLNLVTTKRAHFLIPIKINKLNTQWDCPYITTSF